MPVAGQIGGEPIDQHRSREILVFLIAEQHVLGRVTSLAMAQPRDDVFAPVP